MIRSTLVKIHDHLAVRLGFEEYVIGADDFEQQVVCTISPDYLKCDVIIGTRPTVKLADELMEKCQRIWPNASFKTVFTDSVMAYHCN